MKVVVEQYVPFLRGVIEPYAQVSYLAPDAINAEAVRDADALVVRTRTQCNRELLEGSRVQFIATATIGYDHLDTAYLNAQGIYWTNCPGCNAQGVCDYVEEVLRTMCNEAKCIAVFGVGHVGQLVVKMASQRGMDVREIDPYLGKNDRWDDADVITFHTPLTKEGDFPTFHLADEAFFRQCKKGAVMINAARGGVVDEKALAQSLTSGQISGAVIDCHEQEPVLYEPLLAMANQGARVWFTPHIAGYTLQGKMNASQMSLDALCKHFGWSPLQINTAELPEKGDSSQGWIGRLDTQMRMDPNDFERIRKQYALR